MYVKGRLTCITLIKKKHGPVVVVFFFIYIYTSFVCFEYILLCKSKELKTSSRNLRVPLLTYNDKSCIIV